MQNTPNVRLQALIIGAVLPVIVIILLETGAHPSLIIITIIAAVARLSWLYTRWRA